MSESTPQQRENWRHFECNAGAMIRIAFGPDQILVAPPTAEAWQALASIVAAHGYHIRTADTDSYACRAITGGTDKSLHAYGIALDINWTTNPYKHTPDQRKVRYSSKATQDERAQDVKRELADTDMTPEMIGDARAIKTKGGKQVFRWGGDWINVKDPMHFEIDLKPEELEVGIDWTSVRGERVAAPLLQPDGETRAGGMPMPEGVVLGNFEKVHVLIEKWEGGFSNHPRDPGGPTNMGITQAVLSEWRHRPASIDDVRNLTRDEAMQIFRAKYWTPMHGDQLPLPAAQVVYNTAVLSGPGRAARFLQEALNRQNKGVAVDGGIATQTINACLAADQHQLVEDYCAIYEAYLRGLSIFSTFGAGWMNRLSEIKKTALAWADSGIEQPFDMPGPVFEDSDFTVGSRGPRVEALQRSLIALGYMLGAADGIFGTLTRQALLAFQSEHNMPPTGVVDAATRAALGQAQPRQLSRDRAAATAEDLRALGSTTIKAADNTKIAALISSILGGLGITNSAIMQAATGTTPAAGTAALTQPNVARFLTDVQQLLATEQSRSDTTHIQQVLDAAKQLQGLNVKQILSPESVQLVDTIKALLPQDVITKNPGLATFFQQADALRTTPKPQFQTIVDVLPTLFADGGILQMASKGIAVGATSVIPGFGGSLAALAIGLAANYFANNVIKARVQDHTTGANLNR